MKGDFTRFTFRPPKHYRNVNHQQGRVGLDADWNEQAEITAYRTETEARDVIGLSGAPKHAAGFAIGNGTGFDFSISAGRFYADGILCENETPVRYRSQLDFPSPPSLSAGRHLIYLDVWQRHITALDDPEIREVALGGPDTATRTKIVWQVKTLPVDGQTKCASAPKAWTDLVTPPTGKLSARAQPDAQSDKPCIVPPGAGYRRLENQLYRVEIHDSGNLGSSGAAPTFVWSRENGCITAQVKAINLSQITLTNFRADSPAGFAPGQWIEIIDAGQELRGEAGALVKITAVDDLVLTVSSALPPLTPSTKVRRWDSAGLISVAIPGTNNGFMPLEDGVEIKFENGNYRTGDYWTIPARTNSGTVEWPPDPNTPTNPLPLSPAGINHHYARLAVIQVAGNGAVTVAEDCRHLFPPLTELEDCCGCCTKTVGQTDAADFKTLQEAVDSLPEKGGHVCVLDGVYQEKLIISGRHDIVISGCREQTVLRPRLAEDAETGPIIRIEKNCTNIRIEWLSFLQGERSAIEVLDSSGVTISECRFLMTKGTGSEPAIFFIGEEGLIERNVIAAQLKIDLGSIFSPQSIALQAAKAAAAAPSGVQLTSGSHPASGIQLGGGCRRVRVIENWIVLVRGQGITLGHLEERPLKWDTTAVANPAAATARRIVGGWIDPKDPCRDCKDPGTQVPEHPSQKTPQPTHEIVSTESLWNIRIERNRIQLAGFDGIGVIGFFDLSKVDAFVRVRGLEILGNEIIDCLGRARPAIAPEWVDRMGYGGIALADVSDLVVYDNVIERNGATQNQPACGIFVLHGDGIDIERNRIVGNGALPSGDAGPKPDQPAAIFAAPAGRRGGIQIVFALAPVTTNPAAREATGVPALKLHDNIVSSPAGPAVSAVALGPVSVVGNEFTSGGIASRDRFRLFAPATVFIFNLGLSNEIYLQQITFAAFSQEPQQPSPGLDDLNRPRLVNGNILFADNQCSLDLLEPGKKFILASLLLASFDDIGFLNNQCDCNLHPDDPILVHAYLLSPSVRMIGNRLKEGAFNSAYSAVTTGLLNITAHNETTHCIQVNGAAGYTQDGPNIIVAKTHCQAREEDTWAALIALRNQL
ncbi:MAG TPA: DUF6519 domain-containing protein [Chthoniobacterales bacterium]|nr:DUF6519 domain-containing protein [Chthoniobacterales bacterium]